jgi:penicillin amidase
MKKLKKIIKYLSLTIGSIILIAIIGLVVIFSPFIFADTEMKTSEERLNSFPTENMPLDNEVTVYWNENLIPFIEAETDEDAAFVLGAVNAHLRLGQMELFKMVCQGRLSEMAGPLTVNIDHSLRILDLDKAVDEIIEKQDDHTRMWVQSYVDGINWYKSQMKEEPLEYKQLNIPNKEWTAKDVYSLAKLASADLSWGTYLQALMNKNKDGWDVAEEYILKEGQNSIPSFSVNSGDEMSQIFNNVAKSGSNSLVVSPRKSYNNHALMANDPHLGIFAPNLWFLVGYKSESYHCIGLQIPGIPFIALGRNPHIAWGGTNMRSISTHLIELNEEEVENLSNYEDTVKVRFWFDEPITIRESEYGPVISDAPPLQNLDKTIALQWLGHRSSTNELTNFLAANRATNFDEFRKAFQGYAVSGQTLVYADNEGNIGLIQAYSQPLLKDPSKTLQFIKSNDNPIVDVIDSYDLPFSFNPESGYIASANNLPFKNGIPISFDHSGYNRMERMIEVMEASDSVTMQMLTDLQTDVVSIKSIDLQKQIVEKTAQNELPNSTNPEMWKYFKEWDGAYDVNSRGAVAFEIVMYYMSVNYFQEYYPQEYIQDYFLNDNRWQIILPELIQKDSQEIFMDRLISAMVNGEEQFNSYQTWGDMHRLVFGTPFARVPFLGKKYLLADIGLGGTSNTLMKSAHEFTPEKHTVTYGSNSRHISNMEDIDENYFVLLGGQDAWIKSENNHDQLKLWTEKVYINFPLRIESIRESFNFYKIEINSK